MKVLLCLVFLAVLAQSTGYKLVCYYGSWAVYRPGAGRFDVEQIDPFLCTHVIYTFTGLNAATNEMIPLDSWNDLADNWGKNAFQRFINLKKINPALKTIIAIGGWNEGSEKYSKMAANAHSRQRFISSVVAFLHKFKFDGLDLDWEYPANRGGIEEDKQNFITLLQELRKEFDKHGWLLTAAVSAGINTIETAYDVKGLAENLDFLNVMAYDFHGAWNKYTGHNSPLYARPEESQNHQLLTVNASIKYWIQKGVPPEKLILGMGLYGRSFTLANWGAHQPGAASIGPGNAGSYTREPGSLGYNEICESISSWTVVQDLFYVAPYAYHGNQWVGYDDINSILAKCQFGKSLNLGGAMVWSIETDDFQGKCHGQRFPLLNNLKNCLANSTIGPIIVPTPIGIIPTQTSEPIIPPTEPVIGECTHHGFHRDPNDCTKFFYCILIGSKYKVSNFECSAGLVFDLKSNECQWPKLVPECSLIK